MAAGCAELSCSWHVLDPASMDPSQGEEMKKILFIEPFYGGSHRQLVDLLLFEFGGELFTLPPTKWHWRTRVSALHFAMHLPHRDSYQTLFASSVLNLCEMVSLRPDLARLHKVLYFHENQLVYPVRKQQERDFQYGYNQILSCLVADAVLFNSHFNMMSFLNTIDSYLHLMPDYRPEGLAEQIKPKCSVLYYPVEIPHSIDKVCSAQKGVLGAAVTDQFDETLSLSSSILPKAESTDLKANQCVTESWKQSSKKVNDEGAVFDQYPPLESSEGVIKVYLDGAVEAGVLSASEDDERSCDMVKEIQSTQEDHPMLTLPGVHRHLTAATPTSGLATAPLHILWPHRWEHDKGPDEFCSVLMKLMDAGLEFCVSILGAHTNDIPASFQHTLPKLGCRVLHRGHVPRDEYWRVLQQADVVVSTAKHEFFGVAMLEATLCGCYPLCPNRLVYPEIYPAEHLYNTEQQLFKRLKRFCQRPQLARCTITKISFAQFTWTILKNEYSKALHHNHR